MATNTHKRKQKFQVQKGVEAYLRDAACRSLDAGRASELTGVCVYERETLSRVSGTSIRNTGRI